MATQGERLVDLCSVEDVPPGTMKLFEVEDELVLLVNLDGEFRAMQGVCSHEYFELDRGFLTRDTLTCALHLSRFSLEDGEALDPPAELPLVMYPVVVEGGRVSIEVGPGPLRVNR
jgi:3-phenylpropionate/trans-cinnamate dioxygenase ferredoxin subunit